MTGPTTDIIRLRQKTARMDCFLLASFLISVTLLCQDPFILTKPFMFACYLAALSAGAAVLSIGHFFLQVKLIFEWDWDRFDSEHKTALVWMKWIKHRSDIIKNLDRSWTDALRMYRNPDLLCTEAKSGNGKIGIIITNRWFMDATLDGNKIIEKFEIEDKKGVRHFFDFYGPSIPKKKISYDQIIVDGIIYTLDLTDIPL